MTDQTAARDRATATSPQYRAQVRAHEHLVEAIADQLDPSFQRENGNYETARAVLAILQTYPDRLRDLAGAPTADVATLRVALDGLESAGCQFWACEGPTLEPIDMVTCRTCIAIAKVRAALEFAAPEGVDAADEQHVHRNDMCLTCSRATHTVVPWPCEFADDGMDLEAQGAMAAELAAAQAAIQRVRERHRPDHEGDCEECYQTHPCPTVRALDGDTTEEGR